MLNKNFCADANKDDPADYLRTFAELFSEFFAAECAEQCSDASEDDIPDDATCDKVGNQTSDKKPRNGCRCENRKDAKRFRKAYLNGA